jgi:carbamoyltransferase
MITCGLKLTHDAAICILEDNRLIFSIEIEKLNNNKRYSKFTTSFSEVGNLLSAYNIRFSDIDKFIVDGWAVWANDMFTENTPFLPMNFGT